MPRYTVNTPIPLEGGTAAAGSTVELTPRQAKYLLLAGKIAPAAVEAPTPRTKKSATEKE